MFARRPRMNRRGIGERHGDPLPPFDPDADPSIVFWLDMQDATSFTEAGGVVEEFENKASAEAWAEATNRAAYDATGLNGHPCMIADGTDDRYISTEAAVVALLANSQAMTVVYFAQFDSVASLQNLLGSGNSGVAGSGTKRWGVAATGTWTMRGTDDAGETLSINIGTSDTDPHVFAWLHTPTAAALRLDDAMPEPSPAGPADFGTNTPDQVAIFCRPDSVPDSFAAVRLGELLIFNVTKTATELVKIRQYLQAKWAAAELGDSVIAGPGNQVVAGADRVVANA